METSTKQDKLIFFGITFVTLAALTYIINYLNLITGFGLEHIFTITALLAGIITILKFGFGKVSEKYGNANAYQISGIIWSALATMKWLKYFQKGNFDWIIASLFTLVAIINWISYFRNSKK